MCVVTTTQYKVPTDLTRERYQVISIETFVSPLQVLFIIPRILLIFYQNECSKTLGPRPSSYKEQKLPSVWKHADVTPLPKVKQVVDPKKELRPISLTASLSKVAEDFVVSDYIRPALEGKADPNQFGTVSGSSTVLALLSMIHEWLQATDGNSASVRVFLFDYRKAFDFIDHGTLAAKLKVAQ